VPTANERRALWFLAAVALSGSAVRLARSRSPEAPLDPSLDRQLARVDSVRAAGASGSKAKGRKPKAESAKPKPDSSPVDLNVATAERIEALPGIGPALAGRIVAARDSQRGFRDLAGLCVVRGVGPALVERLKPQVTLSGQKLPEGDRCPATQRGQKGRAAGKQQPR
jgi:competence protein ComEA